MNTLRDRDDSRARPSVWPVYLAAAVLLAVGVWIVYEAVIMAIPVVLDPIPNMLPIWHLHALGMPMLIGVCGVIGLLAAFGLLALRPWGWRLAVVWVVALIGSAVWSTIPQYIQVYDVVPRWALPANALLVWALAARHRLFFPPKPEGEE